MKKLIFYTDGDTLRVFCIRAIRGNRGLEFQAAEISSENNTEDIEFGQDAKRSGLGSRNSTGGGKAKAIARCIDRIIQKERPEFWNLVAPIEFSRGLRGALDQYSRDRLMRIQTEDTPELNMELLEQHFHPFGAGRCSCDELRTLISTKAA